MTADIEIVREGTSLEYLDTLARGPFGDLIKAVVDVDQAI